MSFGRLDVKQGSTVYLRVILTGVRSGAEEEHVETVAKIEDYFT
jgi:hypothetical protein